MTNRLDNQELFRCWRRDIAEIRRRDWQRADRVSYRTRLGFSLFGFAAVSLIAVLMFARVL